MAVASARPGTGLARLSESPFEALRRRKANRKVPVDLDPAAVSDLVTQSSTAASPLIAESAHPLRAASERGAELGGERKQVLVALKGEQIQALRRHAAHLALERRRAEEPLRQLRRRAQEQALAHAVGRLSSVQHVLGFWEARRESFSLETYAAATIRLATLLRARAPAVASAARQTPAFRTFLRDLLSTLLATHLRPAGDAKSAERVPLPSLSSPPSFSAPTAPTTLTPTASAASSSPSASPSSSASPSASPSLLQSTRAPSSVLAIAAPKRRGMRPLSRPALAELCGALVSADPTPPVLLVVRALLEDSIAPFHRLPLHALAQTGIALRALARGGGDGGGSGDPLRGNADGAGDGVRADARAAHASDDDSLSRLRIAWEKAVAEALVAADGRSNPRDGGAPVNDEAQGAGRDAESGVDDAAPTGFALRFINEDDDGDDDDSEGGDNDEEDGDASATTKDRFGSKHVHPSSAASASFSSSSSSAAAQSSRTSLRVLASLATTVADLTAQPRHSVALHRILDRLGARANEWDASTAVLALRSARRRGVSVRDGGGAVVSPASSDNDEGHEDKGLHDASSSSTGLGLPMPPAFLAAVTRVVPTLADSMDVVALAEVLSILASRALWVAEGPESAPALEASRAWTVAVMTQAWCDRLVSLTSTSAREQTHPPSSPTPSSSSRSSRSSSRSSSSALATPTTLASLGPQGTDAIVAGTRALTLLHRDRQRALQRPLSFLTPLVPAPVVAALRRPASPTTSEPSLPSASPSVSASGSRSWAMAVEPESAADFVSVAVELSLQTLARLVGSRSQAMGTTSSSSSSSSSSLSSSSASLGSEPHEFRRTVARASLAWMQGVPHSRTSAGRPEDRLSMAELDELVDDRERRAADWLHPSLIAVASAATLSTSASGPTPPASLPDASSASPRRVSLLRALMDQGAEDRKKSATPTTSSGRNRRAVVEQWSTWWDALRTSHEVLEAAVGADGGSGVSPVVWSSSSSSSSSSASSTASSTAHSSSVDRFLSAAAPLARATAAAHRLVDRARSGPSSASPAPSSPTSPSSPPEAVVHEALVQLAWTAEVLRVAAEHAESSSGHRSLPASTLAELRDLAAEFVRGADSIPGGVAAPSLRARWESAQLRLSGYSCPRKSESDSESVANATVEATALRARERVLLEPAVERLARLELSVLRHLEDVRGRDAIPQDHRVGFALECGYTLPLAFPSARVALDWADPTLLTDMLRLPSVVRLSHEGDSGAPSAASAASAAVRGSPTPVLRQGYSTLRRAHLTGALGWTVVAAPSVAFLRTNEVAARSLADLLASATWGETER